MGPAVLPERIARIVRAGLVALIVVAIVLAMVDVVEMAKAILGAGVLLVLLIVVSVDPASIKKLVVKPNEISLEREIAAAQAAAASMPPEEETDDARPPAHAEGELTDLRLLLQAKLSYIAGHMQLDTGAVNIGSLRYDGYLTDEEAKTADLLLTMSEEEFAKAPNRQRHEFLRAADDLVRGIRASVLAGAVRKELTRGGWAVQRADERKRDMLATRDGRIALVVPLFVVGSDSQLLPKVRDRVSATNRVGRRLIVLPNNSTSPTTDPDGAPAVVKLSELLVALERWPGPVGSAQSS